MSLCNDANTPKRLKDISYKTGFKNYGYIFPRVRPPPVELRRNSHRPWDWMVNAATKLHQCLVFKMIKVKLELQFISNIIRTIINVTDKWQQLVHSVMAKQAALKDSVEVIHLYLPPRSACCVIHLPLELQSDNNWIWQTGTRHYLMCYSKKKGAQVASAYFLFLWDV